MKTTETLAARFCRLTPESWDPRPEIDDNTVEVFAPLYRLWMFDKEDVEYDNGDFAALIESEITKLGYGVSTCCAGPSNYSCAFYKIPCRKPNPNVALGKTRAESLVEAICLIWENK